MHFYLFCSQKESCHVHYCYDHDEDTERMYSREIKPLVSGIFDGRNATIVAYGAIGSGKTHTIQVALQFFPLFSAEVVAIHMSLSYLLCLSEIIFFRALKRNQGLLY